MFCADWAGTVNQSGGLWSTEVHKDNLPVIRETHFLITRFAEELPGIVRLRRQNGGTSDSESSASTAPLPRRARLLVNRGPIIRRGASPVGIPPARATRHSFSDRTNRVADFVSFSFIWSHQIRTDCFESQLNVKRCCHVGPSYNQCWLKIRWVAGGGG